MDHLKGDIDISTYAIVEHDHGESERDSNNYVYVLIQNEGLSPQRQYL
jgi:hypothetical protein